MAIIVPDKFYVYDHAGFEPGSVLKSWTWVGLTTPPDVPGQVTFFPIGMPSDPIITLSFEGGVANMYGPIAVRQGVAWTQPTGGCAVVWYKEKD